jgi:serine/threonine protein kinase
MEKIKDNSNGIEFSIPKSNSQLVLNKPNKNYTLTRSNSQENVSRFDSEFERKDLIGKGGFGSVFRVVNRIDQQEYAIKVIPIIFNKSKELEESFNKIIKEVKALAFLDHQNIIKYNTSWLEFSETNSDDENSEDEEEEEKVYKKKNLKVIDLEDEVSFEEEEDEEQEEIFGDISFNESYDGKSNFNFKSKKKIYSNQIV